MKFIKNHLMFILPLVAILLGVEFFLVFERTTSSYEKSLTQGYTMLVVTKSPMDLDTFQTLSEHIDTTKEIPRDSQIEQVTKGMSAQSSKNILNSLPYFYSLGLDEYVDITTLEEIRQNLETDKNVKKVETFGGSYNSKYKLFSFMKLVLKVFLSFIAVVSLLLIIKQMEIWKYAHRERMQVMEIFGAPLMLRSGVLFKVALLDAIFSTLMVSGVFFALKFYWAEHSGIDIIMQNSADLFHMNDVAILLGMSVCIVIIAVYVVVFSNKEIQE